ncbi:MAG: PLDc N-terminal domain-containing protein [Candidatus Izemoplasmatales bacterium]
MSEELIKLLPLLAPLLIVQLFLQIFALVNLRKRETVRFKNKWIWVVIIVFGTMIGSIVYFAVGGGNDEISGDN